MSEMAITRKIWNKMPACFVAKKASSDADLECKIC